MRATEFLLEAFNQPYPLTWEKSEHGDVDALARLPDGSPLSIMFNHQEGDEGEKVVQVEFYRNNSQEVTGEGDAQRVFATVLSAIQEYIKKENPLKLTFSASKDVEPGQSSESRAKLYDSLVQRYARAWGYRAFRADNGNLVIYELSRRQTTVNELMDYKSAYELEFDKGFDDSLYATAHDEEGRVIDINIIQGHGRKDNAQIEFSRGGSIELTGKGNAERVFATVLTAIDYYLEVIAQPKYLMFQAKEPSRIRFYDALVKRFAPKYGYKRVDLSKTSAANEPGAYILRKS